MSNGHPKARWCWITPTSVTMLKLIESLGLSAYLVERDDKLLATLLGLLYKSCNEALIATASALGAK